MDKILCTYIDFCISCINKQTKTTKEPLTNSTDMTCQLRHCSHVLYIKSANSEEAIDSNIFMYSMKIFSGK